MGELIEKAFAGAVSSASIWGVVIGLIFASLFKALPEMRKVKATSDDAVRDDLMQRVVALELRIEQLEDKNHRQREAHAREMSHIQLKLNNESGLFDMLLMLLEAQPEKADLHASRIKEIRETRARNAATEVGSAAAMSATRGVI